MPLPEEYNPGGQIVPFGCVSPGAQYLPGTAKHVAQVALPMLSAYVPEGHGMHATAPAPSTYLPAGHGSPLSEMAPVPQKRPGVVAMQGPLQATLRSPSVPPNVPIGHGEQRACTSAESFR